MINRRSLLQGMATGASALAFGSSNSSGKVLAAVANAGAAETGRGRLVQPERKRCREQLAILTEQQQEQHNGTLGRTKRHRPGGR